jgi:hypothetical protein
MPIELIDRRGQNKAVVEEKPLTIQEVAVPVGTGEWKEVVYGIVVNQMPTAQGGAVMVIAGRAFGLRNDGKPFCADFWFGAQWKEGFRWEPIAKQRLDTFLDCACDESGPCKVHQVSMPHWARDDRKRIEDEGQTEPPEVIKVFIMAEQNRARIMAERQQAQHALARGLVKGR